MEMALDRTYRVFRWILDNIIGHSAAIIMLGAVLLAILEMIRRDIVGVTFDWGQDAVTYFTVGSIYLYFAVTQSRRSHLAVTAALELLNKRGLNKVTLVLRMLITFGSVWLYAAIVYWGWPAMERSMMLERTTQSMVLEIWPFQLVLLIGFILMAITCLFQLYQDIQAIRGRAVFTWAPSEEGLEI